ncbi:MAG: SpoIIE family protein phosphatase [Leptospiraceae bacterium]|nr:SpoIIE family protein phosphatase [Leptospiraceae bacterium]
MLEQNALAAGPQSAAKSANSLLDATDLDFSKPVEVAPGIYWVGVYLENDPFQCHPYVIRNGSESILIDPGSMLEHEQIIGKIEAACDLKDIRYIILHHQDPDLCAAVPLLEQLINRDDLEIVTHSRMSVLIKHYGMKSGYYNIDENDFVLKTRGKVLQFYTTPYCHSPGAFVTYDQDARVLFSGDIFGGLEESWHFLADENYFTHIEGFHMAYMPSRDILNYALRKIEALDIDLIAPQHGSIIQRHLIPDLISQMKQMECGLYIDRKYGKDLMRTIEKLNNLQTEFAVSLDEIKQLKRGQDGDYFLTSLLMKPLMNERNRSEYVHTDSVLIQKKAFLFKEKFHHLGGDLNITSQIRFQGQSHVFFFNGDGMGKSMQGAGGALVMGTVLNSILSRSAGLENDLSITPSDWLQQSYNEIQTLFLSFDGAMMFSGILGLINEETGELLYLNAEHPFLILYRAGKARFVDEELTMRKFGSPSEMGFQLQRFQLEGGDVLFAGSDGKDDLNLAPESTTPDINYDYSMILGIIEDSQGRLRQIVRSLYTTAEPMDDLSLMRVAWQEKGYHKAEHTLPDDLVYELKISSFIRNGNFQKALELMEGDSEKQSPEILMYRGYCLIREKRFLKSLKYLSRAIQLKPAYFAALKYAGRAHYSLGNYSKAENYWSQAMEIRPKDRYLSKYYPMLLNRLERQKVLLGEKQLKD